MTFITSWEEFSKAAERLYLADPMKVRFIVKYRHCDGKVQVKITDDQVCLQYLTEHSQDVKRIEKLTNLLMRHMASKERWTRLLPQKQHACTVDATLTAMAVWIFLAPSRMPSYDFGAISSSYFGNQDQGRFALIHSYLQNFFSFCFDIIHKPPTNASKTSVACTWSSLSQTVVTREWLCGENCPQSMGDSFLVLI